MLTYIYLSYPQFFQFNILQKSWFLFLFLFFRITGVFFTSAPKQKKKFFAIDAQSIPDFSETTRVPAQIWV